MEKWKLFAIISMIFAGLTSVIAKFGMKNLSSDTALSIRTSVVFGIIMMNAFLFKNAFYEIKQAPKSNLIFLVISGLTTSLSWIFYYRAMKEGPVSYVASIDKASILVTLLLSFVLLKEPISTKILIGAGFILVGMLILIWK
ncbi:membrane protein [Emticicia aquatilis]|uniref:Membrane protein n=1 Tax=Emticicia aquatilis TaxID=1537369 RepID=A0A916YJL1_9BACT|nr:EamA family transporter [Emticicia aquatilis]GGD48275.1 membrane protein [Emticicia aquatilis]